MTRLALGAAVVGSAAVALSSQSSDSTTSSSPLVPVTLPKMDHHFLRNLLDESVKNPRLEKYDLFIDSSSNNDTLAKVRLTDTVCGHAGVAHGGLIASLCDDTAGFHVISRYGPALTANLNISYLKPILIDGSEVLIRSSVKNTEVSQSGHKKVFVECLINNSTEDVTFAKADLLFIVKKVPSSDPLDKKISSSTETVQ